MFVDSVNEQNWYFFAVTGINITVSLTNCIQFNHPNAVRPEDAYKSKIDSHLLALFTDKDTQHNNKWFYTNLTKIYFQVFFDFNEYWTAHRPNIMQFT